MDQTAWKERIKNACIDVGTYKEPFDAVIETLAGILERRDMAEESFDGQMIVEHTNRGGSVNKEQNPAIRLVNDLNRDALTYWKELGLTPAGLKRINEAAIKSDKKESALEKALKTLGS